MDQHGECLYSILINTRNNNAWWGVVLKEPRLSAVGNGLLLYLNKATMAVDSDGEHLSTTVGIRTQHLCRFWSSAIEPFVEQGLINNIPLLPFCCLFNAPVKGKQVITKWLSLRPPEFEPRCRKTAGGFSSPTLGRCCFTARTRTPCKLSFLPSGPLRGPARQLAAKP